MSEYGKGERVGAIRHALSNLPRGRGYRSPFELEALGELLGCLDELAMYVDDGFGCQLLAVRQLDADVAAFYDTWKASYLVSAGEAGGKALYRVSTDDPTRTVSEGQGAGDGEGATTDAKDERDSEAALVTAALGAPDAARSLGVSAGAVSKTTTTAKTAKLTWEQAQQLSQQELERMLYGTRPVPSLAHVKRPLALTSRRRRGPALLEAQRSNRWRAKRHLGLSSVELAHTGAVTFIQGFALLVGSSPDGSSRPCG